MRHFPERTSASDFKDIAFPMFCYSNVVFGLFIATRFWHEITFLPNLAKLFLVSLNENILTLHKNTTNSVYLALLLMMDRQ